MSKGALEFEELGKFLLYLLLLVVLVGLVYFFREKLIEKFAIIKNMVKLG